MPSCIKLLSDTIWTNLNFLLDAVLYKIIILSDAVLHKIIILSDAVLHKIKFFVAYSIKITNFTNFTLAAAITYS